LHGVSQIHFLPCLPENQFFPTLKKGQRVDLIYFCSPNNPTGMAASRTQLQALVAFARESHSLILYDAAYSPYIQNGALPKSIYEIDGAEEVAIEVHSFSKLAGFTGVRLGWSVVPHRLKYRDGSSIRADWNRLMTTLFNGASIISQKGGCAALEPEGWGALQKQANFYMENAQLLRKALIKLSPEVYGGSDAPYLWIRFKNSSSWEIFDSFLDKFHIITTPGSGFGPAGEEFIRITAFGHRETVLEAVQRFYSESLSTFFSASTLPFSTF